MTYRDEFPDFDPATMPAIPASWSDQSWHNDACPTFDAGNGLLVSVNYADTALREWGSDRPRFTVQRPAEDWSTVADLLATDSWDEVLALVARETATLKTSLVAVLAGALMLAVLVPTNPASAEQRSFYDASGRFAGSSSTRGNSTSVYDRSGRFDGSIIRNNNGTRSFYNRSGRFSGSSTGR